MSSRRTSRSTTTSMVCCLVAGQVELGPVGQLDGGPVDPDPGEALLGQVVEQGAVLALAAPDHRGQDQEPGALVHGQDPVDDLLGALAGHRPAADRAVGLADPGVEEPQVVVDLGDRADRGPGVARRRLLVDGDGRGQALDEVHVGLVHLAQELAGVGRQRLDVAALALGVDGVEGQGGLARPGQPGEDDQPVAGQVERDVLEVVLARAAHHQSIGHWVRIPVRGSGLGRGQAGGRGLDVGGVPGQHRDCRRPGPGPGGPAARRSRRGAGPPPRSGAPRPPCSSRRRAGGSGWTARRRPGPRAWAISAATARGSTPPRALAPRPAAGAVGPRGEAGQAPPP